MTDRPTSRPKIAIIGGGIIGLSCAWELIRRGADATVFEHSSTPTGASQAAAGMLAPAYEAAMEAGVHPRLFDLCLESAQLWPHFAKTLETSSDIHLDYHSGPTLAVARDKRELRKLAETSTLLTDKGLAHTLWREDGLREYNPSLSVSLLGGILLERDGWVDNRAVLSALKACLKTHIQIDPSPDLTAFDYVVQATGWQGEACHPVKGQIAVLERPQTPPLHVIRCEGLYIVPRTECILVGATSEPGMTDLQIDNTQLQTFHKRAAELYPPLAKCALIGSRVGIRPVTKDHAPVLDVQGRQALAYGHGRNGILLAPVTAKLMADMLLDNVASPLIQAFAAARFLSEVL